MSGNVSRKGFIAGAAGALAALAGCTPQNPNLYPATTDATQAATTDAAPQIDLKEFKTLTLDMKAWHYDAEHSVWYQLGIEYCTKPATTTYETLAIYVPGAYLTPVDEKAKLEEAGESDTFECEIDAEATVGSFTAATAPIVLPINAPDYAAQTPASSYLYEGLDTYLNQGLVYVYAGFRGRSNGYDNYAASGDGFFAGGCPWAVTELKAAIRYLRYNSAKLPGSTDRITVFGLGSGGLLAQVLGVSGSSELYTPYLSEIGAATHDAEGNIFGDEISAVASWCPDASPVHADAAYEWELGQFSTGESSRSAGQWTAILSENLAAAYASYINDLGLTNSDGDRLTLDETSGGIYTDGSYYEYLVSLAADSAATFLSKTEFPASIGGVDQPSGYFPGSGKTVDEMLLTFEATAAPSAGENSEVVEEEESAEASEDADAIASDTYPADNMLLFASRTDYINALNLSYRWLTYNESKETVRFADLSSYISQCRPASLSAPAFDLTDRSGEDNQLFGNGETESLHFSSDISNQLANNSDVYATAEGYNDELPTAWAQDLRVTDAKGYSIESRAKMYDPLYFVAPTSDGAGKTDLAAHWRINIGMAQTTTPLTASVNLALALRKQSGVQDVNFTPVWEAPRTLAEQGNASAPDAFCSWLSSLFAEQDEQTE